MNEKKLTILGKSGGGGGGDAVWGSITGIISAQTDLMTELNKKANSSSVPTKTSQLTNDSGFITIGDVPAQSQADWNQSDNTQVDYIKNKPSIPDAVSGTYTDDTWETLTIGSTTKSLPPVVSGVNDGTNWTEITIGGTTKSIPAGGSSNVWYGTQAEFDAIPQAELDPNCDYYISDRLDYSEIANTPAIPSKTSQLDNDSNFIDKTNFDFYMNQMVEYIKGRDVYLTEPEYNQMESDGDLKEDVNYHIEHNVDVLQMDVTFTDQSTATYKVYIQPSI